MQSGLFDLNVGTLLHTYPGDRIEFTFENTVPETEWEDIVIIWALTFKVELIAIEEGIDTIMQDLTALVRYEGNEYPVTIRKVERSFTRNPQSTDPDDINPVDTKHACVRFGKILREEILMQIL